MAHQLESLQQSADFYMHGAYLTNHDFGHEANSFEKSNPNSARPINGHIAN